MPFNFNNLDCSPLVIDNELQIRDEDMLAEYVSKIVLGHFSHVRRIIRTLSSSPPNQTDDDIDIAISYLKNTEIEKRDGWLFQMITWIALNVENKNNIFYSQQPHDAPAQHGLDGCAIVLNDQSKIDKIIISEDKCTINPRNLIQRQIWPEFTDFEDGKNNNKLVSRISALLENLDEGQVLQAIQNDIYSKENWIYRIGINRDYRYESEKKRKKLFKGYDDCVKGSSPQRRYASTFYSDDIRRFMENFSQKVIDHLENQKA